MRTLFALTLFCCTYLSSSGVAAQPVSYYFQQKVQFDPAIPKPEEILGYQVGQWHVRHDQLVQYMRVLAEKSPRVSIETIGFSHEQRPLLLLKFSQPDNIAKLEQLREQHYAQVFEKQQANNLPAFIWMGYSVHGNESSGSNAALLVAYYLAAAQGEEVEQLLNNSVVLLDPSLNPDGLARFAQWANSNRGKTLSADPQHREHVEQWPSGRTNHYMFDLNRDWLLLQHPESRARIAAFHKWQPHVLTDFHEMGPNSTYFFQPGIPTRTHPLTPAKNTQLTTELANFHAQALDAQNQLYFTQESFDDFYYGKGSTYPDINGSVGILFEQASSRGHVQETINGQLTFAQSIKNQVTTSLSTFAGVMANKKQLIDFKNSFYHQAESLADKEKFLGYVVAKGQDPQRFEEFMSVLTQHQIKAYGLNKAVKASDQSFSQGDVYIPLKQAQFRLIKAIFSEQTTFQDNTFYDVSGWTLPHAYNLKFGQVSSRWGLDVSKQAWQSESPRFPELQESYAYAFDWQPSAAPKLLNTLLQRGIDARVALKGFKAKTAFGEKNFNAGSIVVASGVQKQSDIVAIMQRAQADYGVQIHAIQSGLTSEGVDLGSRQLSPIKAPKVLLVGGSGSSQYEVGEVWYHLDTQLGIAPTIIEQDRLHRVDLSKYTHIILAHGRYRNMAEKAKTKIAAWVSKGGVIWGHKGGAKWLVDNQLLSAQVITSKQVAEQFDTAGLSYGDREKLSGKQRIAGAIFASKLDLTHPLSFGYERELLPLFKNSTQLFTMPEQPFVTVSQYQAKPLLAGYTAEENVKQIANTAALIGHRYGQGSVVGMIDNPVFRGFWKGSSRLLTNTLFFGHTLAVQGR
ncbi:MAG: peptidase M14 [Pseudoalteromonas sp.]|nr:peptidase M14 [Pseudoalteromonas sp.]